MLWEILVPREMVEATHSIPSSSLPKPSQAKVTLAPRTSEAQSWVGEGLLAEGNTFGKD